MFDRPEFAHPERLAWLAVVAVLACVWTAMRRRAGRERRSYGLPASSDWSRPTLFLAGLTCLLIALAQPRWGWSNGQPPTPGHDVVFVVDVSRSMGAEDVLPNRLGRAVEAARAVLDHLRERPGHRAALVVFAGRAALRCPLTEDLDAVADALASLRPGQVHPGGTDFAPALELAADAFDDERPDEGRSVIVFSDGEDHEGAWRPGLALIRERGAVVHAVAVGDDQEAIVVPSLSGGPMRHQGEVVLSRRRDEALRAMALESGGVFLPLGTAEPSGLGGLYRDRIAPVTRARSLGRGPMEKGERFGVFLGLGAALLVASEWPNRRSITRRRPTTKIVLALLLATIAAAPMKEDTPGEKVREGRAAYARGDFHAALGAFDEAARLAPTSPLPPFNAAAALYRLGRFEEARGRYEDALGRADERIRPLIDFALGNTALALRDVTEAIACYDRCLAATKDANLRRDAEANRAFARKHLPPVEQPEDQEGKSEPEKEGSEPDRAPEGPDPRPGPSNKAGPNAQPERSPADRQAASAKGPEEQLKEAVERIRRGKGREAEGPTEPADPNRKDW